VPPTSKYLLRLRYFFADQFNRSAPAAPTAVAVHIFVMRYISTFLKKFICYFSLIEINENTNDFKLQIVLQQFWNDRRIAFDAINVDNSTEDYVTLSDDGDNKIWMPDTFFPVLKLKKRLTLLHFFLFLEWKKSTPTYDRCTQ
jgi:hypothetical protein